jgi:hypothetical protein
MRGDGGGGCGSCMFVFIREHPRKFAIIIKKFILCKRVLFLFVPEDFLYLFIHVFILTLEKKRRNEQKKIQPPPKVHVCTSE